MPRLGDPSARARLLTAASHVFVEKGLDRAKVEDITQAARLSKGAFYLHFESKAQAFTEILSGALEEVAQIVTRGLEQKEELFAQGLEHMLRQWLERDVELFEVLWKHRAIMGLVLLEGCGSADYLHLTETLIQRLRQKVVEAIQFGIDRGYYRASIDPAAAAIFCSGGFNQVACEMLRAKKKPKFRAKLREYHGYVARAYGTPELIAVAERIHAPSPSERAPTPMERVRAQRAAAGASTQQTTEFLNTEHTQRRHAAKATRSRAPEPARASRR